MENDPSLSGKYLGTITKDFVKISETLKDASYQLRVRDYSNYPIFIITKGQVPVGQLFLASHEASLDWNYYFSYMEEFVQRKIILDEKVEDFKATYKDPEEFCCLFVVDGDFTNFVFIPYPED